MRVIVHKILSTRKYPQHALLTAMQNTVREFKEPISIGEMDLALFVLVKESQRCYPPNEHIREQLSLFDDESRILRCRERYKFLEDLTQSKRSLHLYQDNLNY